MNRFCLVLVATLVMPLCGCEGMMVEVGTGPFASPRHEPLPEPVETTTTTTVVRQTNPYGHGSQVVECPPEVAPLTPPAPPRRPYGHLPQRTSFCAKSSVELKEGCYVGDFELGSAQIRVSGAGIGKTVIHGNLLLKTQCVVSNLTVTGDVIFEGHQAKLVDSDFFGKIIDRGMQNSY